MKCNNCGSSLVVIEGRKSGFCHGCGMTFRVEEGSQIFDETAVEKIAQRSAEITADILEERADQRKKEEEERKAAGGEPNGGEAAQGEAGDI